MQIRQNILAIFLLVLYSFDFAHGITHCENSVGGNHHHVHYEFTKDDSHIEHNDHLDEGIYDYLVCLLSDFEHEDKGCNTHNYSRVDLRELSSKQSNLIKLVTTIIIFSNLDLLETDLIESVELNETSVLPPILINSPRRGPPYISC